jgi:putative membrane protein
MRFSLITFLVLVLFTVIFALQNSDPVVVQILFWEISYPPAILMPIVLLFGALLGVLVSVPAIRKRNRKIEELEDKLNKTDDQF